MKNTIEERLDALILESETAVCHGASGLIVARSDAGAAIIADWNAAAEVIRKLAKDTFWIDADGIWFCEVCGSIEDNETDSDRHSAAACYCAAAQAVLARMTGLHETEDVV